MMKDKIYKIKPLEWTSSTNNRISAETPFGDYRVAYINYDPPYRASYCFDEYLDEGWAFFASENDAREWCRKNWLNRVELMLDEVNDDRHARY